MESGCTQTWYSLRSYRAGAKTGQWLVRMLSTAIGNSPRRKRAKILFETSDEGRTVTITTQILDEALTPGMLQEILDLFWRALLAMKGARPVSLN